MATPLTYAYTSCSGLWPLFQNRTKMMAPCRSQHSSSPPSLRPNIHLSTLRRNHRTMILPPAPHREATAWSVWSLAAGLLIVGKRWNGKGGTEGGEEREEGIEGGNVTEHPYAVILSTTRRPHPPLYPSFPSFLPPALASSLLAVMDPSALILSHHTRDGSSGPGDSTPLLVLHQQVRRGKERSEGRIGQNFDAKFFSSPISASDHLSLPPSPSPSPQLIQHSHATPLSPSTRKAPTPTPTTTKSGERKNNRRRAGRRKGNNRLSRPPKPAIAAAAAAAAAIAATLL